MRVPLTVAEEIFVPEHPDEPVTMQFEIRVSGAFDEGKLRDALSAAAAAHPMIRARLGASRVLVRPPRWEIEAAAAEIPLRLADCTDEAEMSTLRAETCSRPIDLRKAPALSVLLVHRKGGDSLLFNIHHSITDGIGANRFMNSVARAYAGRPDPVPPFDPLAVRDLWGARRNPASARTVDAVAGPVTDGARTAVAPDAGLDGPGYGICHVPLSAERCSALDPLRYGMDSTLNDLILGALHLTIDSWNTLRGQPCDCITVVVPVNLRRPGWYHEVVANVTAVALSKTLPAHRVSPASVMAVVTDQARRARGEQGLSPYLYRPRWQRWVVCNVIFPLLLYRPRWRPPRGPGPGTIIFTSLGRVERKVGNFGTAGPLTEYWATPPTVMPIGVSMGSAVLCGRLHVTLRYRRCYFCDQSAESFCCLFAEKVMALGRGTT
jgi:NRPS condensation-like uncharacterized protein